MWYFKWSKSKDIVHLDLNLYHKQVIHIRFGKSHIYVFCYYDNTTCYHNTCCNQTCVPLLHWSIREKDKPHYLLYFSLFIYFFIKESIQLCLQLQSVRVYDGRAKAWWQELCGVWIRMVPMGPYVWIHGSQLGRILGWIWRCSLVERHMLLSVGLRFQKIYFIPSVIPSCPWCQFEM